MILITDDGKAVTVKLTGEDAMGLRAYAKSRRSDIVKLFNYIWVGVVNALKEGL